MRGKRGGMMGRGGGMIGIRGVGLVVLRLDVSVLAHLTQDDKRSFLPIILTQYMKQ